MSACLRTDCRPIEQGDFGGDDDSVAYSLTVTATEYSNIMPTVQYSTVIHISDAHNALI